jgi:hypothetical protein
LVVTGLEHFVWESDTAVGHGLCVFTEAVDDNKESRLAGAANVMRAFDRKPRVLPVTQAHADIKEKLLVAASRVRSALETARAVVFDCFPVSCEQNASRMLARYVVEVEGVSDVIGVANGRRNLSDDPKNPKWQSHFWLWCHGFIIDITADQYQDGPGPVIVTAGPPIVTADRAWHAQFVGHNPLGQAELLRMNDFLAAKYEALLWHMAVKAPAT